MNRLLLLFPLLLPGLPAEQEASTFPWIELPDGPVAKAWAAVGEETVPAAFGEDFPLARLAAGDAWSTPETWKAWSEWLALGKQADGEAKLAAVRAGLAWLALDQGRNEDAWTHFAACAQAPEWMALLMPRFLPGTPAAHKPGAAGWPGKLENGTLFTPCIPSLPPSPSGVLLARAATVRNLRVGDARFDMKITFDSYGVQLDFEWKSGGPAHLLVLIPEPDGFEIRVEYVDWMRQKEKRVPHRVELSEETAQISLFARIKSTRALWPGLGSGQVPRELAQAGLWLEHEPGETKLELLSAVAQAATRVLDLPVGLRERAEQDPGTESTAPVGVILRVPPPGPERRRKLAWLASTLERYALPGPQAGK